MKHHTRRAVAYIAGRFISSLASSAVYDYKDSKHYSFSGNVDKSQVAIFDYDEGCHIGGSLSGVYHYGNSQHVSLDIKGNNFTGYDYGESQHFSGVVNGSSISIYDYQFSEYFNYSI
jgi:hypothetical protein